MAAIIIRIEVEGDLSACTHVVQSLLDVGAIQTAIYEAAHGAEVALTISRIGLVTEE